MTQSGSKTDNTQEKNVKGSLISFMKKQSENKGNKTSKKSYHSPSQQNKNSESGETEEKQLNAKGEEMTEEEQLEEAKKASRNKAKDTDQTEMYKKLILQNIVKYGAIILAFAVIALIVINLGPALAKSLNGIVYKTLMGAIGQKY